MWFGTGKMVEFDQNVDLPYNDALYIYRTIHSTFFLPEKVHNCHCDCTFQKVLIWVQNIPFSFCMFGYHSTDSFVPFFWEWIYDMRFHICDATRCF